MKTVKQYSRLVEAARTVVKICGLAFHLENALAGRPLTLAPASAGSRR